MNDFRDKIGELVSDVKKTASSMGVKGVQTLEKILKESGSKVTGNRGVEQLFKTFTNSAGSAIENFEKLTGIESMVKNKGTSQTVGNSLNYTPISPSTTNYGTAASKSGTAAKGVNSKVDFGGTITIDVKAPPGVSQQEFKTYFESEEFKRKIYEYYNQKAKELERR